MISALLLRELLKLSRQCFDDASTVKHCGILLQMFTFYCLLVAVFVQM